MNLKSLQSNESKCLGHSWGHNGRHGLSGVAELPLAHEVTKGFLDGLLCALGVGQSGIWQ